MYTEQLRAIISNLTKDGQNRLRAAINHPEIGERFCTVWNAFLKVLNENDMPLRACTASLEKAVKDPQGFIDAYAHLAPQSISSHQEAEAAPVQTPEEVMQQLMAFSKKLLTDASAASKQLYTGSIANHERSSKATDAIMKQYQARQNG